MGRDIPSTNEIKMFLHCKMCLQQNLRGQDIEVGWTELGIQIWCRRHDANMMHVDFEGAKHPANLDREAKPGEVPEKGNVN